MRRSGNHSVEKIHPEEGIRSADAVTSFAAPVPRVAPVASAPVPKTHNVGGKAYGSLREAFCFTAFLVVFLVVTVYDRGTAAWFYYSDSVSRSLAATAFPSGADATVTLTLPDVQTMDDVWNWFEGPLANTLFPTTGESVLGTNQIVGSVRLRQVRVRPNSCTLQSQFAGLLSYCYGALSPSAESTAGFGPVQNSDTVSNYAAYSYASTYFGSSKSYAQLMQCISGCEVAVGSLYGIDKARYASAYANACSLSCTCFYSSANCNAPAASAPAPVYSFNWTSADATQSAALPGLFTTIPGSGFVVDLLPANTTDARAQIAALKAAKYLDVATRAVLVEVAVFNPYLELFDLVTVLLEVPPTGGVYATLSSAVVDLSAYSASAGGKVFFEGLLALGVVLYAGEVLVGMLRHTPRRYFSSLWSVVHGVNLMLFVAVITLRLVAVHDTYGATTDWTTIATSSLFAKLRFLAAVGRHERGINAVNALLTWALFLKYTQVSQGMFLLLRVLAKAGGDLWSFLVLFGICLVGYAQAGFVAFSTQAPSFRTFGRALVTLVEALRFRLDYDELASANPGFAPVYFASFYVLVILMALNVLVAILQEAYTRTDRDAVFKFSFPFEHGVLATLSFYLQRQFVALKYGRAAANNMTLARNKAPAAVLDRSLKKGDVHPWMMMEMQALTEKVAGVLKAADEKKGQLETMEAMLRSIEDTCMELKVAAKPHV
ncbi:Polycystin Cation Channel (PCC) Family [Achlya hypogyna]|uniref:Polycystin Cation Channel (PCC) Family n=1 Tax=Achlya hypogyna TaxID=1202772 RepID=A0A1V9ZIP3_ACHHY|nr:Polycystin Cation Channel (PCC) Family [Achlya hypogyna]